MTRDDLRETLAAEGVNPQSYRLNGEHADETYILEPEPIGWAVYYSERGLRSGERLFADEDAACAHLLGVILRDSTTRR